MRFPGFIGPSYTLNSVNVDCQRCVNMYPELNETGHGKEQEVASLVPTPGLRLLVTLGSGPNRGAYTSSDGRAFMVSGNTLYELDSNFNSTNRGTLNSSTGQISMADDGFWLMIVDGSDGYTLELSTNTFAQIVDANFLGGDQVVVIGGYFLINKPNNTGFYRSSGLEERAAIGSITDPPTFPGDESGIDGDPDFNNGMVGNNGNLWMFNTRTTEVYYNSGDTFPFTRIQGAFIEHGCAAKFSVVKMNNAVFWLGQDEQGAGMVFTASGYQPERISTHAVELAISGYANISQAVAFSYQENGHHFYVLNFPSANTTWVYDTTTSLWHERTYTNQGRQERHRASSHTYAFNTHLVGDYQNGKVYQLTSSVYDDDGAAIKRQRVSPHITSDLKRIFYSSFQLDMETGVGLDGLGQGTDPKVMLDFSDDGGHSWSNEKWASIGKQGQRKSRAIWQRLGSSRDRVYRITITDPIKVTLIGAELNFTVGNN